MSQKIYFELLLKMNSDIYVKNQNDYLGYNVYQRSTQFDDKLIYEMHHESTNEPTNDLSFSFPNVHSNRDNFGTKPYSDWSSGYDQRVGYPGRYWYYYGYPHSNLSFYNPKPYFYRHCDQYYKDYTNY